MQINNLVVVSDLHAGCKLGLCPPGPQALDMGGVYLPSKLQVALWSWWETFWYEWVPAATNGEPFAVVINGDTTDGRHHGSVTQISQNLTDQKRIAQRILRPIVELCEGRFFMTRGTESHVGPSAENEEALAEALNAIPDECGNYARFELWIRVGGAEGALVHVMHHIGTTGRTHYETSAVQAEMSEGFCEAGRWGDTPPDVTVRSHRHRYCETRVASQHGYSISTVTPGWQLKTPFVYRIPGGRTSNPQCGGVLVRKGDEELHTRAKVFSVKRSKEVVI